MTVVAVTGGIGAGKSVVCRVLGCMGYPVYDCDNRARGIMDDDAGIKRRIADEVDAAAIRSDGSIDRQALSRTVFSDPAKLASLNGIVHAAVRADLGRWLASLVGAVAFVETAILYQSRLDRMVDEVWDVVAPVDLRVRRVCLRNSMAPEQVMARIDAQQVDVDVLHPRVRQIVNDDCSSLLLQIHRLLAAVSVG